MEFSEPLGRIYEPILDSLRATNEIIREEGLADLPLAIPTFVLSGKRLRSAGLLFAARAFGEAHYEAAKLGAGVELIHASSLVHDDVVDNSRFRRNALSLHYEYGPHLAVLAGDFLFTRGLRFIDEAGGPLFIREAIRAVSEMVEGEVEEEVLPPQEQLREAVYLRIIYKKTASLFQTAMRMGAMIRNLPPEEVDLFGQIGFHFGMAYQIVDDCDDLFSHSDPDFEQQKITLPTIKAFQRGTIKTHEDTRDREALRQAILEAQGFQDSIAIAKEYLQKGLDWVEKIPDPELQTSLKNFFDYLEDRAHRVLETFA